MMARKQSRAALALLGGADMTAGEGAAGTRLGAGEVAWPSIDTVAAGDLDVALARCPAGAVEILEDGRGVFLEIGEEGLPGGIDRIRIGRGTWHRALR